MTKDDFKIGHLYRVIEANDGSLYALGDLVRYVRHLKLGTFFIDEIGQFENLRMEQLMPIFYNRLVPIETNSEVDE